MAIKRRNKTSNQHAKSASLSISTRKFLDAYVGRYQFGPDFFIPRGIYSIEKKNEDLMMIAPGANATLVPQSESEFFESPFLVANCFCQGRVG